MVHSLIVVKESLDEAVKDKAINFPPLEGLMLELMENKNKLKKNLPPVKIRVTKPKPTPAPPPPEEKSEIEIGGSEEDDGEETSSKEDTAKSDGEDDIIKDLGDKPPSPEEEQSKEVLIEDTISPEEKERQEKEEYIWRHKILKKQHPTRNISQYNEHDDLHSMKTNYERTLKEIQLEVNVDSYRMYLKGGFWAVQIVCTNFLGIDMNGFALQQINMMDKYDRFLIELGERSYNNWGSSLPVEIRLLGFIVMQAGLFYVAKIMVGSGGVNMATLFGAMSGQEAKPTESGAPKMKGPSVKVEDIRKEEKK